ncbi:pollen-specific leucine-rich repeat extensin-like protein 2 [Monomorium pharaonis]|uniref:pollen-specific leucine-rich repeat extensin-like protein 2 n=1 Tax=Monomorium pharaonis TaxID=307658 RepID=UPI00063EE197|nr:pollen-specific leucine-rich repeat extensin-like protein 2 [Monomorium pharaonis]
MDSAATLVLFALIVSFVGDAAASCRKVANEEMVEYVCEGGHPADLAAVPETAEKLRITKMPLRRITTDTFSRFGGNLWVLSCSHCEITDIDPDAFRRLVNLQQLNLDSNRLTTVRASWFEGLVYLTYLDLSYNDIRDIEDGVYRNLPGLVDLRVSGNRLRCLNLDEMAHLRELKRMYLSENSDFACPHAVSKFLENQGVTFEQDPEWRRLASDMIDVHVPPSNAEEDKEETVPAHRERLHPDRRPPPEESGGPHADRDRAFYPYGEHRPRHRRPQTTTVRPKQRPEEPLPRVEPRFPDARPPHVPSETLNTIPETPPASPSEDMKISSGPSRTEHTLTYPDPTRETTPYWPYSTPERSRTPPVPTAPLSEDRVAGTEHTLTYPPSYIPTYETTLHPTSVGSRVPGSEDETRRESGRPSQGSTATYPLYITTSDGLERMPPGSAPLFNVSEMIMWETDDSLERPTDPSWVEERHEQSRRPAGESDRTAWSTRTPYYGHDPREMIVEESSSPSPRRRIDEDDRATDRPVQYDPSRITTTASTTHYVRPSPPELMHSPSTDEFYQAPYYEPTVTVHPPMQKYQNSHGTGVRPIDTTTNCPENSAPTFQSVAAPMTLVVTAVLGRALVERF